MPRIRAVVTDLDNTLYPWVDYIVPSLEAMVASLASTTGLPRVRIVQALKAVYSKYQSNEYPFAIQESGIFEPYEADFDSFNALVLRPARDAFVAARDKYLRPYPGVRETLDALRARGLKVVGLTDAPRNAAELRLKHLRLDGHFDALYTLPGYPLPDNVDPEIRRKEEAGQYRSRTPVVELPQEAEKPSSAGLARILADFRLRGGEVLYVGDNVKKDMPVAAACGATGVWAEYGTYVSAEYRERLAVISAKAVTRRHVADETPMRWPLSISSFVQVLELASPEHPRGGTRRGRTGARATRALGSSRMRFRHHVFVCENRRPPDDPRGSCGCKGSAAIREALKAEIARRGLKKEVRANAAGCLDACADGPSIVVYPEGVWYGHVSLADVEEIVERHLVDGVPVERLRLKKLE